MPEQTLLLLYTYFALYCTIPLIGKYEYHLSQETRKYQQHMMQVIRVTMSHSGPMFQA